MTDAELIAYLKLQGLPKDIAAANRIEELEADNKRLREVLDVDPWYVGFAHWKAICARAKGGKDE